MKFQQLYLIAFLAASAYQVLAHFPTSSEVISGSPSMVRGDHDVHLQVRHRNGNNNNNDRRSSSSKSHSKTRSKTSSKTSTRRRTSTSKRPGPTPAVMQQIQFGDPVSIMGNKPLEVTQIASSMTPSVTAEPAQVVVPAVTMWMTQTVFVTVPAASVSNNIVQTPTPTISVVLDPGSSTNDDFDEDDSVSGAPSNNSTVPTVTTFTGITTTTIAPPLSSPSPSPQLPQQGTLSFTMPQLQDQARSAQVPIPPEIQTRIQEDMQKAINVYNTLASFSGVANVIYDPAVPTADATYQGTIRFGNSFGYSVSLHELSHFVGIGTHPMWASLIKDGLWTGKYGLEQLKELDGPGVALHADTFHFWPYGLNYREELVEGVELKHVKMVTAMLRDMQESLPPQ